MEGIFRHIDEFNNPIVLPRYETEISYPSRGDSAWRYRAEEFEGLARTLLVAAPLIKERPETIINGYNIREYYANQIIRGTNPASEVFFGRTEDMLQKSMGRKTFQHICECASLAINLTTTKSQIWDGLDKKDRDHIAAMMSDFGHFRTNHHNWRFFNIIILSFLHINGYKIDKEILKDHLQNVLTYYVGNGWYRDGNLFDYYSPWAFQFYGPIWCSWYGYELEPKIAEILERNSNELMENYSRFFDVEGRCNMWGRSNIYRSAASSPMAANFLLNNSSIQPGLARRILSGNLLQFIGNEETFINGIPCLGFYRPFKPLLQSYSCSSSPFWFGNSFIGLSIDRKSPLWTAEENNGIWESIGNQTKTTIIDGPGIVVVNQGSTGVTEMITAKVLMSSDDSKLPDYSRLSFNSAFLWETYDHTGPAAMNYTLKYGEDRETYSVPNLILYGGEKDGAIYRRMYFDFEKNFQDNPSIDLTDIPIINGVIRVDRPRICEKPYRLLLAHYGLPHINGFVEITEKTVNGNKVMLAKTKGLQLAFVTYRGWDHTHTITNNGLNAVTNESTLIYAESSKTKWYEGIDLLVTALLHKTSDKEWTEEELSPVKHIEYVDYSKSGSPLGAEIHLNDGRSVTVDYGNIEGRLSI
jgi:hypothetical protein